MTQICLKELVQLTGFNAMVSGDNVGRFLGQTFISKVILVKHFRVDNVFELL